MPPPPPASMLSATYAPTLLPKTAARRLSEEVGRWTGVQTCQDTVRQVSLAACYIQASRMFVPGTTRLRATKRSLCSCQSCALPTAVAHFRAAPCLSRVVGQK